MFELMKKRIKNEKGLTLVEVLAVVVILAIVAAIAIPAIGNMIENSRVKAMKADAINVISAANIYYTDGNKGTFSHSTTDLNEYLSNKGSMEEFSVDQTGVLTTGKAVKGNITLTFTKVTVEDIDAESPEVSDTGGDGTVTKTKE